MKEMDSLIKYLHTLPGLQWTGGVTEDKIRHAESILNLSFADDFKAYLSEFGQISANGIELAGLSNRKYTSVVNLTQNERKLLSIPANHYVIEDIGLDGLIYTQDNTGSVYQLLPNRPITKVADNLELYIKSTNK
jgi:hypothetical protein